MTDQPKPLPCPWCGADRPRINRGRFFDAPSVRYRAVCVTDGCCSQTGWHATEAGAAEAWNRRAPDPEREAMARVCGAASDFVAVQGRYGFEQQAFVLLDKVLADLERARKGTT